ncbi:MAG: NIPSNAP family protein [Bryobacterales bacterium]|nr:NIPSNAP family protein [Bryobacterales bacterium]
MTFNRLTNCIVAFLSFAAGSLFTARLTHLDRVQADGNRAFELRIYHTVPGKVPALETRFRDTVTKLFAKHDIKAVGYWVPEDAPASNNTFIYLLAHPSRDEAKQHWAAVTADPEFKEMMKAEQADKLVEKVDSTYMDPADFSPMK